MEKTITVVNNDTGSLKVGTSAGDHIWAAGQKIQVETKLYTLTYVMGKGEKCHVCAKGCGPFPLGTVSYSIVN